VQVDHHRVWRELVGQLDRGEPVRGGSDHRELRLTLDQRRQCAQKRFVVVGEQDPDRPRRLDFPHGCAS